MERMQSTQSQCCCCAASVFSALFGIIMAATGICLVLNYRIMEVDTGGLPPEWQNEEGKKIVGIILICCGFGSMGISALITALSFTVCARPKVSVTPSGQKVAEASVASSLPSSKEVTADPYSSHVTQRLPPGKTSNPRHMKRHKNKHGHLKSYKNSLTPHREVVNEGDVRTHRADTLDSTQSLDSCQTTSSMTTSSILESSEQNGSSEITVNEPSAETDKLDYAIDGNAVATPSTINDSFTHLTDGSIKRITADLTVKDLSSIKGDNSTVILKPIELPSLAYEASVHSDIKTSASVNDNDDDVSQIEEVKRLDKDIADHNV